MLSFSTGAIQTMFQPDGINGDINVTLWPLQVTSCLRVLFSSQDQERKHNRENSCLYCLDNCWISCVSVVINLLPSGSSQNGILAFCGFQVLAPQIFWCPAHSKPEERTAMLDGWRARLKGLMTEKPLTFAHCELFNVSFQGGFLMRPEVKRQRESEPFGLTTGHHLGKPLPPDNQLKAPSMENCDAKAECGK